MEIQPRNCRSQSGVVIAFVALLLFVVFGFAAFTVDVGRAMDEGRRLQTAADAGSIAASRLLGTGQNINTLAQEACSLATSNGINAADVQSVACGVWNAGAFTASCITSCGSASNCSACTNSGVNSIRVVTRKPVDTTFGRMLNMDSLSPSQESIARVTITGNPNNCMRPFGVETSVLGNPPITPGQTFVVGSGAPGNWGKLDIDGINMSSGGNFVNYMQNGICSTNVGIGQAMSPGTGFGGNLISGFNTVLNTQFVIARVSNFPNGNSGHVTILEFLMVTYLGDNGQSGQNWQGTLRLDAYNVTPPNQGGGSSVSAPSLAK